MKSTNFLISIIIALILFLGHLGSLPTNILAKEKEAGDANDSDPTTFSFSPDNKVFPLTKRDGTQIQYSEVNSLYGTEDGMIIYDNGIDVCSSAYAGHSGPEGRKNPVGMDLSDAAGWPDIEVPFDTVAIDPLIGRFKFSKGRKGKSIDVGHFNPKGMSFGLALKGQYAYVTTQNEGLQIWDISNVKNPKFVSSYKLPTSHSIYIVGSTAFISTTNGALYLIDISNPAKPDLRSNIKLGGIGKEVYVAKNHAYVAAMLKGIYIVDVSNLDEPTIASHYKEAKNAHGVYVSNDIAYVAAMAGGFILLDVSNPRKIALLGKIKIKETPKGVYIINDRAYLASEGGLNIVDVSNPSNPSLVGTCDTFGNGRFLEVRGDYAYVASEFAGLNIINIKDEKNPVKVETVHAGRPRSNEVKIHNGYLFQVGDFKGIYILDVPRSSEAPRGKVTVKDTSTGITSNKDSTSLSDAGRKDVTKNETDENKRGNGCQPGECSSLSFKGGKSSFTSLFILFLIIFTLKKRINKRS
jgi:hypothetical protein